MRKGNKSKVLMVVLALALALSTLSIAYADGGLVDMAEFEEVLNEAVAVPDVDEPAQEPVIEEPADEVVELAALDGEVELEAAVDEDGITLTPGRIFVYNDRLFKVLDNAENIVKNGDFNNKVDILASGDTNIADTFLIPGESSTSDLAWADGVGRNGSGALVYTYGTFCWRHKFSSTKTYAMSIWYKLEGSTINFYGGQRGIAGAIDATTGLVHTNEIGASRPITGGWQQDFVVFHGDDAIIRFLYAQIEGSGTVYVDDFYIYEVEEYAESIGIDSHYLENSADNSIVEVPNISIEQPGKYYHIINYTNYNIIEYPVTGVVAVMKDGALYKLFSTNTRTVRGYLIDGTVEEASGSIDIPFEIKLQPGEDISQYSYIAYMVNEGNPFSIIGKPQDNNAVVVSSQSEN